VRMLLPPIVRRREMDKGLVEFFHSHRKSAFRRAIADFCAFYHLRRPRIEWYEYIDWGKTAGRTFEDGRIHLVHPENWKRGRVYNSERMWVQAVYHELAHYLFWTDAERKAEAFTRRMVRGLRRPARRTAKPEAAQRTSRIAGGRRTATAARIRTVGARRAGRERIAPTRAARARAGARITPRAARRAVR
jgi:predicted SprT family Zn-dependent metalloprotease